MMTVGDDGVGHGYHYYYYPARNEVKLRLEFTTITDLASVEPIAVAERFSREPPLHHPQEVLPH